MARVSAAHSVARHAAEVDGHGEGGDLGVADRAVHDPGDQARRSRAAASVAPSRLRRISSAGGAGSPPAAPRRHRGRRPAAGARRAWCVSRTPSGPHEVHRRVGRRRTPRAAGGSGRTAGTSSARSVTTTTSTICRSPAATIAPMADALGARRQTGTTRSRRCSPRRAGRSPRARRRRRGSASTARAHAASALRRARSSIGARRGVRSSLFRLRDADGARARPRGRRSRRAARR